MRKLSPDGVTTILEGRLLSRKMLCIGRDAVHAAFFLLSARFTATDGAHRRGSRIRYLVQEVLSHFWAIDANNRPRTQPQSYHISPLLSKLGACIARSCSEPVKCPKVTEPRYWLRSLRQLESASTVPGMDILNEEDKHKCHNGSINRNDSLKHDFFLKARERILHRYTLTLA